MMIIRVDGNSEIGIGHIMRCLTIVEQLKHPEQVQFICAQNEAANVIREYGYQVIVLHSNYQDLEEELPLWETNIGKNSQFIKNILVDSYYVTNSYLLQLKQYGKVFLMDDFSNTSYAIDTIIIYNAYAT